MKQLRETAGAAVLLALMCIGAFLVLNRPAELAQDALKRCREACAALPEPPGFTQRLGLAASAADEAVSGQINAYTGLITLYGGFQRLIGNRIVQDASSELNVVRLENGKLNFIASGGQPGDPGENAAALNGFAAFNASLGIPTLYVAAPQKISRYDSAVPAGAAEFGNENADALLALLDGSVDTLDLRDAFWFSPRGHDAYFFNTDHHWTPEGAFLAFQTIAARLERDYGFSIDPAVTDLENYRTVTYKDLFLGSQGKRVGPLYAGMDDFTLLLPAEETSGFTYFIPNHSLTRSGSFEDAFLFPEMLEEGDCYTLNPYVAYTGGDYPLSTAFNENDGSGKKILLIRQSFSCALAPFLARACSQLDILDLRYYEGSVRGYVAQTKPDLVLVVYCVSDSCNPLLFEPMNR